MKLVRRHPIFFTLVAIIVVAIGVEGWLVFSLQRQERVLEKQLTQKITEIERLLRQRPGPTDENLRRAREDFAQSAEVLATMLRSLNVTGPDELEYFKGEPAESTDAYFDIQQFVDAMVAAAKASNVIVRPNERFGFNHYLNEGPPAELIRPVYRQRRIIEYLLTALFAAGPRTLESVQREDPRTIVRTQGKTAGAAAAPAPAVATRTPPAAGGAGGGQGDASGASDFFSVDPQISARTPGYVDTMAFRIVFTGQTGSLRGFMNALAVPEIPLVVRSVEVEQLRPESPSGPGGGRSPSRAAEDQTAPADLAIVSDNESRFIVTVELFEVKLRAPEIPGHASNP